MAKKKQPVGRPKKNEVRDSFARWLALPKETRTPRTKGEWEKENGVVSSTTWRWQQDPVFRQSVLKYRLNIVEDSVPLIIKGLTNRATEGELGQAKFLFELMGDYTPKSETKQTVEFSEDGGLSEEEIEFLVEEMVQDERMPDIKAELLIEIISDIILEEE